jgi:hypothetical protein
LAVQGESARILLLAKHHSSDGEEKKRIEENNIKTDFNDPLQLPEHPS